MNLDVVSLLKNKPLMKSITWEISPETILMQEDFLDSNMASNTICSRDNGDEDTTKGKDHEALEGPMTKGRLKQAQHVIETRLVICIAAIDDD